MEWNRLSALRGYYSFADSDCFFCFNIALNYIFSQFDSFLCGCISFLGFYFLIPKIFSPKFKMYVQPEFRKCWDVFFFFWIKWKLKDFQITWAKILFTIEHNKYLNWEILHFYPLNELISNLMPATGLKKVGTGATKGWKSKTFWKASAGRTSSN